MHRVERAGDDVTSTPLLPDYLQSAEPAVRPVPFDVREFREARYGSRGGAAGHVAGEPGPRFRYLR